MKTKPTLKLMTPLSTVALAAMLLGCDRKEQTVNQTTNPDAPAVTATDVKKKYQEAATTTKDYVVETKDAFVAASDQKLRDLDTRIDELAQKSEAYQGEAKVQADKTLAELRDQRDKAKQKFTELKDKAADAWSDAKAGFTVAMNNLEKAYDDAKSKFN